MQKFNAKNSTQEIQRRKFNAKNPMQKIQCKKFNAKNSMQKIQMNAEDPGTSFRGSSLSIQYIVFQSSMHLPIQHTSLNPVHDTCDIYSFHLSIY